MTETTRPPKLILTAVCLVLGGAAYFAAGYGFNLFVDWLAQEDPASVQELAMMRGWFAGFCYVLGIGSALLTVPLWMRQKWAWIAALVVMGTYAASAFLPIGALGLWGLLDKPTREWFGISS